MARAVWDFESTLNGGVINEKHFAITKLLIEYVNGRPASKREVYNVLMRGSQPFRDDDPGNFFSSYFVQQDDEQMLIE